MGENNRKNKQKQLVKNPVWVLAREVDNGINILSETKNKKQKNVAMVFIDLEKVYN